MATFEWTIALLLGAALLAAAARKLGAPYPTFIALGGTALAFLPNAPDWTLDPPLALTLFVAPVLLDAAYDSSLRDLRKNWRPIAGLVIAAVGTTVAAVAVVAHWLVPAMPWTVAIALGAIVAPPDAAAASAVMRQVGLPHRLLKILEGESLLNDASALLVYRLAIMTVVAGGAAGGSGYVPVFLLTVFGSLAAGVAFALVVGWATQKFDDVPTSLILQFASVFGIWIAAEAIGLSGILTIVAFAMTIARRSGQDMPARMRVPVFAVWEVVVFVLNVFAFLLIGMQLRPIWTRLAATSGTAEALIVAGAVLVAAIAARFVWVMPYAALVARRNARQAGASAEGVLGGGLVLSWCAMRGIVTLAAAFAIPETLADGTPFPFRDLILLCAFAVVLGTLVIQGLTIKPLLRRVGLTDDDPVGREIRLGRAHAYRASIDATGDDDSLTARLLRKEYEAIVAQNTDLSLDAPIDDVPGGPLRRRTIDVARRRVFQLRRDEVIGDDAFRVLLQELDWAELSAGGNRR